MHMIQIPLYYLKPGHVLLSDHIAKFLVHDQHWFLSQQPSRTVRSQLAVTSIWSWVRWGFKKIVEKILKLKPKGLLVAGPPCGSWIWVNRSTSQRSQQNPFGNSKRGYVRDSNATLGFKLAILSYLLFEIIVDGWVCWKKYCAFDLSYDDIFTTVIVPYVWRLPLQHDWVVGV